MARRSDPETSHAAAAEMLHSGKLTAQQGRVLALVAKHPGCTSLELAAISDGKLDRYQIARRLPELKRGHVVRMGSTRKCNIGDRPAVTWWPERQVEA
jgi:hypothetical protein